MKEIEEKFKSKTSELEQIFSGINNSELENIMSDDEMAEERERIISNRVSEIRKPRERERAKWQGYRLETMNYRW